MDEENSAHVDWDTGGKDINESEARLIANKDLDIRLNQLNELETVAGNPNSNLNSAQAVDSMYNNHQPLYEPLRVTEIPHLLSTISETNLAMARPNVSESGRSSSASRVNATGLPNIFYETPIAELDFEKPFQDDHIYYHPSLLRRTRGLGATDHHPTTLSLGPEAYSIHGMNGAPLVPRQQQVMSYSPQRPTPMGTPNVPWNQMSQMRSSQINRPSQEGYGASDENTLFLEGNNASASDWSPNKFLSSLPPPQAYDYLLQVGITKVGFITAKEGEGMSLDVSTDVQRLYAQDRLRNNTMNSTSIGPTNEELSISKAPTKKKKITSLDVQAFSNARRLEIEPPVSVTRQIFGSGTTVEKDACDLRLEEQVKENEKLYKKTLYYDHCKRFAAFFFKVTDQRHIDLASGTGIMVRNLIFGEAIIDASQAEQSSPMFKVGPYLGRQSLNPERVEVDPNTGTHLRTAQVPDPTISSTPAVGLNLATQHLVESHGSSMDCDSDGENEIAPISDIEYRKQSTMSLNLPERRKTPLSAARTTKKQFATARAQNPRTQPSIRLPGPPAEQQSSKLAVRTPRKRKVLEAQDPGPRNFLEHEFRFLHELHHQLKPGTSYPSDRSGWSTFLVSNGSAWKTFLSRNETPTETATRLQAIAEHKAAVEHFERGEKARGRQARRQRQDVATAASEAKIKAMTEKNLQKRAENPDMPWRDLRQA
ncbi:hypothetical protein BDZ45DRAFT_752473 [Acephala macrosclerotiorum]|nr:hypothetical protein BDZ45DRAFT_752473 [Acephala macrosclerotiorum]